MKKQFVLNRMVSFIVSAIMLTSVLAFLSEPVNANTYVAGVGDRASQQETEINPFEQWDKEYSEDLKTSVSSDLDSALIEDKEMTALDNLALNRYNLKFKSEYSYEMIYDLVKDYEFNVLGDSSNRMFSIESTEGLDQTKAIFGEYCEFVEVDAKLFKQQEDPDISSSALQTDISELAIPNDPYVNEQWYLDCLRIKNAWDYSTGSQDVFVAVIDSGVDRSNPDLAYADIRNGYDCSTSGSVMADRSGHGTSVTGIIAATMNNRTGIAGISPGVAIVPFCVENEYEEIYKSYIIDAIYYAADIFCQVINISLGGTWSDAENEAIQYAYERGCIIIAAAGNDGDNYYYYPASYNGVISVGSIDQNNSRSVFSNYNNCIDVMAPGEYILTTNDEGTYSYCDGTSFSSPCVAAIAALSVSVDPSITPLEFEEILQTTSVDLGVTGYDNYYGYGLVNAYKIMQMLNQPRVSYQTHVQDVGWQGYVSYGAPSGTSGQSKRLEAIRIKLEGVGGGIEYRTHVQDIGWQDWVANDALSGTSGQAKRLEAIEIRLTGEAANLYDVYYRVHAQNTGWMDWAKNGQSSGTAGYSYRLEAIEIQLVAKGGAAPGPTATPYIDKNPPVVTPTPAPTPTATPIDPNIQAVLYKTHVQDIGWQAYVGNGDASGTSGQSKRLEGIQIKLQNIAGGIEYSTHIQDIGWQGFVADDAMSGTSGQSKRLEAIQIRLTGAAATAFDVYYCVHAQNTGWLDWAKNGQSAGTAGFSYRLEAIKIVLVPKGGPAPGPTARAFVQG